MMHYTPHDWFWIVGGDEGRRWSSAAGGYVATSPTERTVRIATEEELSAVLRAYGLPGPKPNADDVRAEAQRRIIALTGARDMQHCMVKQLNALMRVGELNDRQARGETLTPGEEAEATALRGLAAMVKAIRAASNEMEAAPALDYTANANWP